MKILNNYLKNLVYSILELVSSLLNIVFALLYIQYSINLGVEYLAMLEINRINKEIIRRQSKKDEQEVKSKSEIDRAKEDIDNTINELGLGDG